MRKSDNKEKRIKEDLAARHNNTMESENHEVKEEASQHSSPELAAPQIPLLALASPGAWEKALQTFQAPLCPWLLLQHLQPLRVQLLFNRSHQQRTWALPCSASECRAELCLLDEPEMKKHIHRYEQRHLCCFQAIACKKSYHAGIIPTR